jgi:hypothetical protein
MADGELENHAGTPRLPDQDRPLEAEPKSPDQRTHILDNSGEVVATLRLVGVAVAAQIDRHGRMAGRREPARDAVPQPRIRRQAVYEQERRPRRRDRAGIEGRLPPQDAQLDASSHSDPLVDRFNHGTHHCLLPGPS